jgi:hemerythrin
MLCWTDQFATGSPLIDAQHRILIDQVNRLGEYPQSPPINRTTCDELMNVLSSYVATHFKFEEECMQSHRCPAHDRNKLAHAAFIQIFASYKARYGEEGPKVELLQSLHSAASTWIRNHILSVDTQLRPCVPRAN